MNKFLAAICAILLLLIISCKNREPCEHQSPPREDVETIMVDNELQMVMDLSEKGVHLPAHDCDQRLAFLTLLDDSISIVWVMENGYEYVSYTPIDSTIKITVIKNLFIGPYHWRIESVAEPDAKGMEPLEEWMLAAMNNQPEAIDKLAELSELQLEEMEKATIYSHE